MGRIHNVEDFSQRFWLINDENYRPQVTVIRKDRRTIEYENLHEFKE